MTTPYCNVCETMVVDLGQPSRARWVGADGKLYCSIHHTRKFGHGAKLVRIEGYEPPPERKPAARNGRRRKRTVNA